MDGVDDDRDFGALGGEASEEAALPLCVWTMSGRVARKSLLSSRQAWKSRQGWMGRTSAGRRVRSPGEESNKCSREPSGPGEGPAIKSVRKFGRPCRPRTVAMVFSCAPPIMRRVMTCVTRMPGGDDQWASRASSCFLAAAYRGVSAEAYLRKSRRFFFSESTSFSAAAISASKL